ncbi:LBH domain-containing protein 1 [Echinops telfairi]|uniref:LBH domain-containing protein 1 n=1 Tax=Echinops telfairi TaxID=9371 RepID=A0AC55DN13_ECHTE|nr:LBH domain-containing protein 1 [Echinops telfairi]
MALVPGCCEQDGPWPSDNSGPPRNLEDPRLTNHPRKDSEEEMTEVEGHQDVQVESQKPHLPSIAVEASEVSEESGELHWSQELLLLDDGEEDAEAFFQDQNEEPGWAWNPLEPRSPLKTLNPGFGWGQEQEGHQEGSGVCRSLGDFSYPLPPSGFDAHVQYPWRRLASPSLLQQRQEQALRFFVSEEPVEGGGTARTHLGVEPIPEAAVSQTASSQGACAAPPSRQGHRVEQAAERHSQFPAPFGDTKGVRPANPRTPKNADCGLGKKERRHRSIGANTQVPWKKGPSPSESSQPRKPQGVTLPIPVQCPCQHYPVGEEAQKTPPADPAGAEGEGRHGSGSPPKAIQDS